MSHMARDSKACFSSKVEYRAVIRYLCNNFPSSKSLTYRNKAVLVSYNIDI